MKLKTFLRSSIIILKYIILGSTVELKTDNKKKEYRSSNLTQEERDEWFRKNIENKVPDKVKPAALARARHVGWFRLENVEKKPWLQDEKKDRIKTALVVQLITIAVIISVGLGTMTFFDTPTPVFAENLNFLFKFGDNGSGPNGELYEPGALLHPSGIEVDDSGKIYVTDENNHVQVFDSSGKFLYKFSKYGHENGEFDEPFDMALDSSGRLYVVDIYNNRVQIFDKLGRFIDKFGYYCQVSNNLGLHNWHHQKCIDADETGPLELGDGGFIYTHGLAVDDNSNRVYVLDYGNNRVQVYEWQETKKNEWFHHKIPHV